MIIRDKWKAPAGRHVYRSTDKTLPPYASYGGREEAYYMLSQKMEDILGPEGGTAMEVYRSVTGPLGLSSSDTIELLRAAKKEGYLE